MIFPWGLDREGGRLAVIEATTGGCKLRSSTGTLNSRDTDGENVRSCTAIRTCNDAVGSGYASGVLVLRRVELSVWF